MKRRPGKKRATISAQAAEAFKAGDRQSLGAALGIRPWEPNPLVVDGPLAPEWARHGGTAWSQAWPASWDLRQQLEAVT